MDAGLFPGFCSFSAILAFLGNIFVTSAANLGASRTIFNLGNKVVII
jgi:hypothetical protein